MDISSDDLARFIGAPVDDDRADLMIDLALQACSDYFSDDLPDAAKGTVLSIVARAYSAPVPVSQQAVGPYSVSGQAGGLFLNKREIASLRRLAGGSSAFSINPLAMDAGTGLPPWDANGSQVTVYTS
jgi:hypothetical protein